MGQLNQRLAAALPGLAIVLLPALTRAAEPAGHAARLLAVGVFADQMSHKGLIGGENEGLEHLGVRHLWPY